MPNESPRFDEDLGDFTDLYLLDDPSAVSGFLYPGREPIPSSMHSFCRALLDKARKEEREDFSVIVGDETLRAHRLKSIDGPYLVLRRMPKTIRDLDSCGFPAPVQEFFLHESLNKGGLVVVCGKPGNGKSTTCAGVIVKRLELHGGLCLTIEDPAEMPLHGPHGDGFCIQTDISGMPGGFAEAVRGAMRSYPTKLPQMMMLVGEVRDADTACEALRSAVDGRLVITTVHSAGVVSGLQRILSLASDKLGEREARELLASGLRLGLHQRLESGRIRLQLLVNTPSVTGRILNGEGASLDSLENDRESQRIRIQKGELIPLKL